VGPRHALPASGLTSFPQLSPDLEKAARRPKIENIRPGVPVCIV
jgi:hypothetical protein